MNELLGRKLEELRGAREYECWYLVKQPTEMGKLCYLVSALESYKERGSGEVLSSYISRWVRERAEAEPGLDLTDNYRALRVAAFFGLITMRGAGYKDAAVTPAYREILLRCGGRFEDTSSYQDIIDRQIEKVYLSSEIDEEFNGVRRGFRLYPVMLLYKLLLELGRTTGNYAVSITEYKLLAATTKRYQDYLRTLTLISLMREDDSAVPEFEALSYKFDNRMLQALKQLSTLRVDAASITIAPECLETVAERVHIFENRPELMEPTDYVSFLGSTASLTETPLTEPETLEARETREWGFDSAPGGENLVIYGTPGCGKSYYLQNTLLPALGVPEERRVRTTFHPDYSNADFIGQIIPRVHRDGSVSYEFDPGPFTIALRMAIERPESPAALVIEELNRGSAPGIFGDIFQLLDRDANGRSLYPVANTGICGYLSKYFEGEGIEFHSVRIPGNLTIAATMNTSDQNVFTLDTAFKRRWRFLKLPNSFEDSHPYRGYFVPGMPGITWQELAEDINDFIVRVSGDLNSEDKQLGVYFMEPAALCGDQSECGDRDKKLRFAHKLLEYLWDDVAKFNRPDWFRGDIRTLDGLIEAYMRDGERVFADGVIRGHK